VTRLSQVLFGILVAASLAAFFVAQELKSEPSLIQDFQLAWRVISPNADSRNDAQRVRFKLKEADTVDVAIVDSDGDEVREIVSGSRLGAYRYPQPTPSWDGRDEDGDPAPDGVYRVRITLRDHGRTVIVPDSFRVDRTPPVVRIVSVGPDGGLGPEILPTRTRGPARIRINAPARSARARMLFFRTDVSPARLAAEREIPVGSAVVRWNGTDSEGHPVPPGTYLAVAEVRDAAGNIGTSTPLDRSGLPLEVYGRRLPGRGGITVRRLAAQPPLVPGRVGGPRIGLLVDARNRPYDWSVRRVGGATIRRGRANRPQVALKPPGSKSGVYLFEATRGRHRATVPFAVDDAAHHRVLVVLPLMTWQGRNLVDDDGDGLPNDLEGGHGAKLARVLARPLPVAFAAREAPTLIYLDSGRHRYDVTTDLALALRRGPRLEDHAGVLIAGDAEWLPPALQRRLRRFVQRGGTVATVGVDSLLRQARLTPRLRLVEPTPRAAADLWGARITPVEKGSFDLVGLDDELGLFAGTGGRFPGFSAAEVTTSPGRAKLASSAVTADGRTVIVGLELGRGTVIRFGLPELPARLRDDAEIQALMERTWDLLSR
jgi:hypothetical protein